MKREIFNFQSIVRNTPDQSASKGSCEELINIRVDGGTLRPVRRHKKIIDATNYIDFIEHSVGSYSNKLAIIYDNETKMYSLIKLEVIFNGDEEVITPAYDIIRTSSARLSMKAVKNMIIVNDPASDSMITYQFADDTYKLMYDGLPSLPSYSITKRGYLGPMPSGLMAYYIEASTGGFELNTRVEDLKTNNEETGKYAFSSLIPATTEANATTKMFNAALISALNEARTKDKNYTEGYVLLSLNFTLVSGEETKMTPPILLDLGSVPRTPIIAQVRSLTTGKETDTVVAVKPEAVDIVLSQTDYSAFKNIIRSVNIYTTNSISHLDMTLDSVNDCYLDSETKTHYVMPNGELFKLNTIDYESMKSVLFFKQKELPLDKLNDKVTLVFGDSLVTEKTMKVDNSGWLKTSGETFVYNNRVHLFNYTRSFTPESSIFSALNYIRAATNKVINAAVKVPLSSGASIVVNGEINAFIKQDKPEEIQVFLSDFVSFVDSRAEYIYLWFEHAGNKYAGKVFLKPSVSYNIAFRVQLSSNGEPTIICPKVLSFENYITQLEESNDNSILVSAIGAPYYYPVEHSYPMPARINSLALMSAQVSEAQQGQFPLFVFTQKGVYAIEQGNGAVLYASVIPISTDIARKTVQTKSGIAYIANGNVMILHGRNGQIISSGLDGEPDFNIRLAQGFSRAHGTGELYDCIPFLSDVDFKTYLSTSILIYDNQEDELIVSSSKHAYSYVFSFRTQSWHKISETFEGVGGTLWYAIRKTWDVLTPAEPARAKVTIQALTVKTQTSFAYLNKCTILNADRQLPSGTQVSMIIGASRLAIYSILAPMPLYMIIEIMCQKVNFLEHEYNNTTKESKIYTNKAEFKTQPLTIKSSTGVVIASDIILESPGNAIIAQKGIGAQVSLMVGGVSCLATIVEGDTYTSLAAKLAAKVNELASNIATANAVGNVVHLTTVATGLVANNTTLSFSTELYCAMGMDTFGGGGALGGIGGSTIASADVVSLMERERTPQDTMIHIQSKPFLLGSSASYSTMKRAILRGEIIPSLGNIVGVYLWASNNLSSWYLISQVQTDRNTANLRLKRGYKAWRYFVLSIGGIVDSRTDIAYTEIESEEIINRRIR